MQFNVVANVTVTIMAHPPLFWSAVPFSYIQQQWTRIIDDKVETRASAPIWALAEGKIVQFQGKGVYAVRANASGASHCSKALKKGRK
jgi:hypothetical protein